MTVRVVNSARSGIHETERQVITALQRWDTPGIAVSGAKVTVVGGRSAEIDRVILLPNLALAVEVKGLRERVGGTLHCPVEGDWSMDGIDGEPVYSQARGNPRAQAERVMWGFKNLAEDLTAENIFVDALVLVVPWPGLPLTLDKGRIAMPTGQDVMLFDPTLADLKTWVSSRSKRAMWAADQVGAILTALGFTSTSRDPDQRVGTAELDAAFAAPTTEPEPAPEPERVQPVTPRPRPVPVEEAPVNPIPYEAPARHVVEPEDIEHQHIAPAAPRFAPEPRDPVREPLHATTTQAPRQPRSEYDPTPPPTDPVVAPRDQWVGPPRPWLGWRATQPGRAVLAAVLLLGMTVGAGALIDHTAHPTPDTVSTTPISPSAPAAPPTASPPNR